MIVGDNAFRDSCLLVFEKFNIGETNIEVPYYDTRDDPNSILVKNRVFLLVIMTNSKGVIEEVL